MKKISHILLSGIWMACLHMILSIPSPAQSVTVFDPTTFNPNDLPTGMEIVEIEGEDYLQIVLDAWNSQIDIPTITINSEMYALCKFKFALGNESLAVPLTLDQIKSVVYLKDTVNKIENPWGEGFVPSGIEITQEPSSSSFRRASLQFESPMQFVHQIQFYGQKNTDWASTVGDTLWVGKIDAIEIAPHVDIQKTETAPLIDGVEDAIWDIYDAIPILQNYQGENPTIEAYWKMAWCDSGIYALLNVQDNDHWPFWEAQSGGSWEYDGAEIYFDVNAVLDDGLGVQNGYGHLQSAPQFEDGGYGTTFTQGSSPNDPGGTYAYQLTGQNWVREHFFYFTNFENSEGATLTKNNFLSLENIGFDVYIIDQDEGILTTRSRKVWQNTGTVDENWNNMDDAGTITLVGENLAETDSLALVAFYNATNGADWNNNGNWLTGNIDTWWGVTVADGRVTELIFTWNNNLNGQLPVEIGNLSRLTTLILNGNENLTGPIPATISNLIHLQNINFESCNLTGAFPAGIGNMAELRSINLSFNNFDQGDMPDFTQLVDLLDLRLIECNFTSDINNSITGLTNLQVLDLSSNPNMAPGPVPDFSALSNLNSLGLGVCNRNNAFPNWLDQMTNLVNLNLSWNNFVPGTIPDLSPLTNLVNLDLGGCSFNGNFPTWISSLIHLENVNLSWNNFEGTIPADINLCASLYNLNLEHNQLTGPIPAGFWNLTNLQHCYLNNNRLSGTIPTEIGNLVNLETLNLSENQFSGSIVADFADLVSITDLYINSNGFFGDLPSLNSLPSLNVFHLNDNKFTFENLDVSGLNPGDITEFAYYPQDTTLGLEYLAGTNSLTVLDGKADDNTYQWFYEIEPIPGEVNDTIVDIDATGAYNCMVGNTTYNNLYLNSEVYGTHNYSLSIDSLSLVIIYNELSGNEWANNENWLTGPLADWHGVKIDGGRVARLQLANNNLSGELCDELFNLTALDTLDLQGNFNLSGSVPMNIGLLTDLSYLSLWNCNLSGDLPATFWDLTNLTYLDLNDNLFSGEIPSDIGDLTQLIQLWLGGNQFSGTIPAEVNNLVNLTHLDFRYLPLDPGAMPNLGNLTQLIYLNMRECGLTGAISPSLSGLTNLQNLYLLQNNFDPAPMPDLSALTNLKYFYANECNFTGSIPTWLGSLTNLIDLRIGYNQLSGQIPAELSNLSNLQICLLYLNNLEGNIPASFANLSNLRYLYLHQNNLSGDIPLLRSTEPVGITGIKSTTNDLTAIPPVYDIKQAFTGKNEPGVESLDNLLYLYIYNNLFTFANLEASDILPGDITGYGYAPQDTVLALEYLPGLNALTVLDGKAVNNTYGWLRNETEIGGEYNDTLLLGNMYGDFKCTVNNTVYNALELNSETYAIHPPLVSHVDVGKATMAPVIDGIADAVWDTIPQIYIGYDFIGETPTVDAYWKAMWADSGIFVLLHVNDDDHWPGWAAGGNSWEYDAGEVYFDVNAVLDDGLGAMNGQGHYSAGPIFEENMYGVTSTNSMSTYAYQLNGENWVSELFYPFDAFENNNGDPMSKEAFLSLDTIGFDVYIIDQDEGITTERGRKVWKNNGTANDNWTCMDDAGTIALVGEPVTPNIDISSTSTPPVIDGIVDNIWNSVSPVPIEKPFLEESPTVTAQWRMLWDSENFYVLMEVQDDNHWPSWESGGTSYEYDRAEFYLDVNETITDGQGVQNAGSGHYQQTCDFQSDGYGVVHSLNREEQNAGGTVAYVLTGESYVYEWSVPFANLHDGDGNWMDLDRLRNLGTIGFDVTITDQDQGVTANRQRKVWQSDGTIDECWNNMDGCGTITMVGDPPPVRNIEVHKTETAAIIDGVEDAIWNDYDAVAITKNFQSENPTVDAYWKAMWADSGLFVLLNVQDDDHWPAWEAGGNVWEYDDAEVYFDVNEDRQDGLGSRDNLGHYQSYPAFENGYYGVALPGSTNNIGNLLAGWYAHQLTGENWVREYFFPFDYFIDKNGLNMDLYEFLSMDEIGFDVTIVDQDEGITTARQRKVWQNEGITDENWANMDDAGTITLVGGYSLEKDSLALVAFYNATNGDGWNNHTNWLTGTLDTWWGITLENGRVSQLDLGWDNNLTGQLPNELGDLTRLTRLNIPGNGSMGGALPASIGNLKRLEFLNIEECDLTGTLPDELLTLSKLTNLNVGGNSFDAAPMPDFSVLTLLSSLNVTSCNFTGPIHVGFIQLSDLTTFNIGGNPFNPGPIPDFSTLTHLVNFYMDHCNLTGSIPLWLTQMTTLEQMVISGNNLSGSIPAEMANLTELRNLDLGNNDFAPAPMPDLSALTKLTNFNLRGCDLTGTIPAWITSFSDLNWLNLADNQLTGSIPSNIGDVPSLLGLYLENNQLSGSIPASIGSISNLWDLVLHSNSFTGTIPTEIGNLTNLEWLQLQNNQLSGEVPVTIGNLINLRYFNASSNQLSGAVPASMGNLTNLNECYLNNNNLSGNIPASMSEAFAPTKESTTTNPEKVLISTGSYQYLTSPADEKNEIKIEEIHTEALSNLNTFWIQDNRFTFNDIESSGIAPGDVGNFDYAPQDTTLGLGYIGGTNSLTVLDGKATENTYQWYYNVEPVPGETNDTIVDIEALGGYYCKVNNTTYPDLELTSEQYGIIDYNLETDSLALVAIYQATQGDGWNNHTNWLSGPLDTWFGVTVEDERVTKLEIPDNNLNGELPVELGYLTGLTHLHLGNNGQLAGNIPSGIGNLTLLEELRIYYTVITGTIPETMSNLVNLTVLDLGWNNFSSGTLPDLSGATNLTNLLVGGCHLTGAIPSWLLSMNSLRQIIMDNNDFTSGLMPDFSGLTQLNELVVSNCNFTGEVPSTLIGMNQLVYLNISENDFTAAPMPNFNVLTNLQTLTASFCNFTGEIPSTIDQLTDLWYLNLEGNSLSGAIPSEIGNLTGLGTLNLADNQLTGEIPSNLGNLVDLWEFYLNDNQLTGEIPASFNNLTNLGHCRLNDNFLRGDLPSLSESMMLKSPEEVILPERMEEMLDHTSLLKSSGYPSEAFIIQYELRAENNLFTFANLEASGYEPGDMDDFTYAPQDTILCVAYIPGSNSLTVLDGKATNNTYQWYANNTLLTDETNDTLLVPNDDDDYHCVVNNTTYTDLTLSSKVFNFLENDSLALVAFYNATGGDAWDNRNNWLGAPVATWHGVTVSNGRVTNLNLAYNNLNGQIPEEIGELTGLMWLTLTGNENLTGPIPASIGNLAVLGMLRLYNCGLTGTIPGEILDLSNLVLLELSWNNFDAAPMPDFGMLHNLNTLTIEGCNFIGTIPAGISSLTNLTTIYLNENPGLDQGAIPDLSASTELITLGMNNCNRSGTIPAWTTQLASLEKLTLAGNSLTGYIPTGFITPTNIVELDYSWNLLEEEPMPDLSLFTNLESLTLAGCNLTGEIPAWFTTLTNLTDVNLSFNQLEGNLPAGLGDLSALVHLNVEDNAFTGQIPAGFSNLTNLRWGYLSANTFSGNIPDLTGLTVVENLSVRNNRFTFANLATSGLEPGDIAAFTYHPQDTLLTIEQDGTTLTVLDDQHAGNQYDWYLDDVLLESHTRSIEVGNDGDYRAEVSNTTWADLTLYSDTMTVETQVVPENEQVSNYSLSDGNTDCINALNTITVAGDETEVIFQSGSSVTLIAGYSIRFLPGFHAQNGSYMSAYITTTGSFCDALPEQAIVEYTAPVAYKSETVEPEESIQGSMMAEPSVKVYPNPTTGSVRVEWSNMEGPVQLTLFNSLGAKLAEKSMPGDTFIYIDLANHKRGVYFVNVRGNNAQQVQKIVLY